MDLQFTGEVSYGVSKAALDQFTAILALGKSNRSMLLVMTKVLHALLRTNQKQPDGVQYVTGWQRGTCVGMLVKVFHWLTKRYKM